MIGSTISHYRILKKLGEGGMGEVYLAEDKTLERRVALKFLPLYLSRDSMYLARFEREAKAAAALQHSNIVTIHEIGAHDGRHFIAMSYIEGELLGGLIARKPMTIDQAVAITCELCDAYGEAHDAGIIHRDIKPNNILIDRKGRPHVLDFGLAATTGATKLTQDGTAVGSLNYMSPEQSRGDEVDHRTDIFSLGAVLYEMITGQPAFPGDHVAAIQYSVTNEDPQPLARYQRHASSELERIVAKALAKDRDLRYQTMSGLAAALKPLRVESGVQVKRQKGRRFHAGLVGSGDFLRRPAVISGLAMGVVGVVIGAWLMSRSDRLPPGIAGTAPAAGRFTVPLEAGVRVVPSPATASVAISPDGKFIAYTAVAMGQSDAADHSDPRHTHLYLRPMDRRESVRLEGTRGAEGPVFSPDGKWIAFSDGSRLLKIALSGGAPVTVCELSPDGYRGGSWGDNGRIYFGGFLHGIYSVPVTGGTPESVTEPDHGSLEKTHRFPHILPGSRGLLFTRSGSNIDSFDDADVALLSLETGDIRVLVPGGTNPWYAPTGHIVFGRAGDLLAVPFDVNALKVTGPPFTVLRGVITSSGWGAAHFAFSRNGTLVYVPGGPEHYYSELLVVDGTGRIHPLGPETLNYGNVRVSPDGNRMAVTVIGANAKLTIHDLLRGTTTRLTHEWDSWAPAWHPRGDRVACISNREGVWGIWEIPVDGASKMKPLVISRAESMGECSWGHDGRWLSYSRWSAQTGNDIWVVSSEGDSVTKPVIEGPLGQFNARFSPDGDWIAYVSEETGRPEVYVQPFPPTGQKWKLSENGGDMPLWSSNGDKLFYLRGQRVMVVSIVSDPGFSPSRAQTFLNVDVADIRDWDLFPNDQRFIVIARPGKRLPAVAAVGGRRYDWIPAETPELHVVVNWFEEMK